MISLTAVLLRFAMVAVLAAAVPGQEPASQQEGGQPVLGIDELVEQMKNVDETDASDADPSSGEITTEVWCGDLDDPETTDACWKAYRARLSYYETGLAHRSRVFAWQHFSTRIIFFVVNGLVLVGVLFAWMQFRRGLEQAALGDDASAAQPGHEIELSMKGVKVSSPVLGVIILTLSLAFFYLYLVYVYPIKEIF